MKTKNKSLTLIVLILLLLACSIPTFENTPLPPPDVEEATIPPPQDAMPTSPQVENSPLPPASPVPTVQHLTQPGEPNRIRTWVSDISSAQYASEHRAMSEYFNGNLYERPFTAGVMQYQPYLDLIKTELGDGGEWIYVVLSLEGSPPAGSQAFYAIEIDTDRDGRGDWFIGAIAPPSTTWTTDGVKVWYDTNNDVGGSNPTISEAPLSGIDGYDELIFDAGYGTDPDFAWARIDPSSAKRIQLAFKHSLIQSADTFLWGGWSDEGPREASWFDYNDHFTLAEAGSPLVNKTDYPLKALFSVDNTCRWGYGFEPTTPYPGLCPLPEPTPIPPTPTIIPSPLCPPPTSYHCENWNYITCECDDLPPSCPTPVGGCGENSEWLPYPDCYCAPY